MRKPGVPVLDQEAADAVLGARPNDRDIGHGAVGDPGLLAVEDPAVAVRRAVVRMPAGFEPKSGSVRPKQPIASPRLQPGQPALLLLLRPDRCRIGYITSAPCTHTKLRRPESPRSSSCMISPYSTLFMPAQP